MTIVDFWEMATQNREPIKKQPGPQRGDPGY